MIKFGTGGFRGVIGDDFTKANVQLIAQALANVAHKSQHEGKPIIIGYDNRFMSDYVAGWFSEVLAANEIKVFMYTAPVPTPTVMCATKDMQNEYGIMITASHNPYIFNGIKLFLKSGVDADVEFTDILEKEVEAVTEVKVIKLFKAKQEGLVIDFSNILQYLANIKSYISPDIVLNKAKILYDNMCGVGIVGLEPLAKEYAIYKFDMLHTNHDAFFNFALPNPTEEALGYLKAKVVEGGYDYAIATDSDGDRLGVIDEKGNYVNSNDILGALYYYLIKYKKLKGDIVKNCSTSVLMDKLAAKLGYKCHEVDVGFKNISSKIREVDALIGGESSGGLTVRSYIFGKDSVFSASLFMEMQIMMKKPVSQIINEVHKLAEYDYYVKEDSIVIYDMKVFDDLAKGIIKPFDSELVSFEAYNRNVKYHFANDCWALVRMSGTEPVLRLVVEMENKEKANAVVEKLKQVIEQNAK